MSTLALIDAAAAAPPAGPLVEVVVPVHNEQRVLQASITRLHRYLQAAFPFPFRITIADNASTDATWPLAQELAERAGFRIHEIPVDWVDDPDSRVAIVPTALEDLRGVVRLGAGLLTGSLRARLVAAVPASPRHRDLPGQLARFVVLRAVLHPPLGPIGQQQRAHRPVRPAHQGDPTMTKQIGRWYELGLNRRTTT